MRKFLLLAIAAAVALSCLAVTASARIDHHFKLISAEISSHRTPDGFAFHNALFATFNPNDQVGNDRGRCSLAGHRKFHCKVLAHLNGEVGGAGFLFINGNFGHGDHRLNITGGTGQFEGAAGKVNVHGDFLHVSIVR